MRAAGDGCVGEERVGLRRVVTDERRFVQSRVVSDAEVAHTAPIGPLQVVVGGSLLSGRAQDEVLRAGQRVEERALR